MTRSLKVPIALASVALLTAGTGVASAKTLEASLSGNKEVPRTGDRDGRGSATITTNRKRGRVCYDISLSKVGSVVAGHIHRGGSREAGAVVVSLFASPTTKPKGCVRGVSKSLISEINKNPGRFYVNVHNQAHPDGAVRGQLHD